MKRDSSQRTSASKSSQQSEKPRDEKPRPDFPLSIHQGTGYQCKKVKGHVYYPGRIQDDPKGLAALEQWFSVKDNPDLLVGGQPRTIPDDLTINELVNPFFLVHKESLRDKNELSPRTYQACYATSFIPRALNSSS